MDFNFPVLKTLCHDGVELEFFFPEFDCPFTAGADYQRGLWILSERNGANHQHRAECFRTIMATPFDEITFLRAVRTRFISLTLMSSRIFLKLSVLTVVNAIVN